MIANLAKANYKNFAVIGGVAVAVLFHCQNYQNTTAKRKLNAFELLLPNLAFSIMILIPDRRTPYCFLDDHYGFQEPEKKQKRVR
jgi:hypothetical protein